ncbi:uncharacterized protein LOC108631160 [Ceratina calcarata]|uniref:Uncharacterized protein LOC108631160 n=1 Tax=Ceratina calcarata TaxID=156304 RepID=A0AAJ7SBM3_9HYME|nr:uncharacterized protein LOC108631160 [Ceratina calcarata]XP_026674461.1 uncharacterized protein LOC108631160 [Ceratina calcarata]XP_026674462.1 uncharacterized protein LOC108631160 [Ceratina calcarata]XP_026674463.1 uncharacterized protein LOC108631160 [Ceratina calcarata]XP_026674464.1 uncharacterized protein LOC108631160 [Ceratina calcarata]XP_026674465.1 uncharacterized protein LOC108631160 [Ceratina calcarata]
MIGHCVALVLLILIIMIGDLSSVTIVDHHPDEEYYLEHEVSYDEAIRHAKDMQIYPGPVPGCKLCTRTEMSYCEDSSVINDHCCCDGSFNEVFPFVKHSCQLGPQECKVLIGDCAEYARLRECCCHNYLASLWKHLANDATSKHSYDNNVPIVTVKFLLTALAALRFLR